MCVYCFVSVIPKVINVGMWLTILIQEAFSFTQFEFVILVFSVNCLMIPVRFSIDAHTFIRRKRNELQRLKSYNSLSARCMCECTECAPERVFELSVYPLYTYLNEYDTVSVPIHRKYENDKC